jgi:general stress protein 26
MKTMEIKKRIMALLSGEGRQRLGLLVTADAHGRPHGTYMGSLALMDLSRLLTMTSPDSRKVRNILENPQVEWLFLGETQEEVLYVQGTARVLQDPDEVEEAWRQMSDKTRAYFLSYQTVGIQFLIFETKIDFFEYRIPLNNEAHRFEPKALL